MWATQNDHEGVPVVELLLGRTRHYYLTWLFAGSHLSWLPAEDHSGWLP